MPAIKCIGYAAIMLFTATASSQSDDYFAEAPLDVLKQASAGGRILMVEDFVRKNKGINIKAVATLCSLPTRVDIYGSEELIIKEIFNDNKIVYDYILKHGFVNLICDDSNFIIDAMFRDSIMFRNLVSLGFDLNRPLVYKELVGTPLDIAQHMFKNAPKDEVSFWRTNIRHLKRNSFKTCHEQGIRCSIDQ